jgi:hypothetical protein
MKLYRVLSLMIVAAALLTFTFALAQDATQLPPVDMPLPVPMETELIPCTADSVGPCETIATSMNDIVGVWKQYLLNDQWSAPNGMAYQHFFPDGSYNIADTSFHSSQPFEDYPAGKAGSLHFDDGKLTMEPDPNAPPPFNNPAVFQVKVLKYDNHPVALRFVPISDTNFIRLLDLTQVMIWYSPG